MTNRGSIGAKQKLYRKETEPLIGTKRKSHPNETGSLQTFAALRRTAVPYSA
ncbi:hypothetical protein [Bacteroides pyogenes]|uniref:hypothetical protein n=1 Tax=Bacteroides pyogenes TaxID=310300 RepID=UPI001BA553AB|nr:hypothetical protein [Bacteroides pyogenes]